MAFPLPCSSSRSRHPFAENGLENEDKVKEWEETRCPVCMEHPHNAILLLCSSHNKGCRPFMCDTSYRHSNCFNQFKKSFTKDPETTEQETISVSALTSDSLFSEATITNTSGGRNDEGSSSMNPILIEDQAMPKLMCPLCRGDVNGYIIVDSARRFMDAKARTCASETCDFSGTYSDLRKHARTVHPSVRPTVADPERQRKWSRLERRRDFGDFLSSLQSPIVGEDTEEIPEFDIGNWITMFFHVPVFPATSTSRSSGQSIVSRTRLPSGRRLRRRWGDSTDIIMPAPGEELYQNELPGNTRSVLSIGSSGTGVIPLGRRSRRQRGESPEREVHYWSSDDEEVHHWSSDGGPERGRGLQRRRHRGTSPEN